MGFIGDGLLYWTGFEGGLVKYDFTRDYDKAEITGHITAPFDLLLRARAAPKPVFIQLQTGARVLINIERLSTNDRAEVSIWEP